MKVRRDVSSIPSRSAEETWNTIVDLVTGPDTVDRDQLVAAEAVLASLIADELFAQHPLTWSGVGARLVLYLRYGADAIQAGDSVDRLTWNPTAGDWRLQVPCGAEDLAWAREALSEKAPRVELHEAGAADQSTQEATTPRASLRVNWAGGSQ